MSNPLLSGLLRRRYVMIGVLAVLMTVGSSLHLRNDADWQYFTWGSDLLFGQHHPFVRAGFRIDPVLPGGLHLYANYPILQIGPPPLLLAKALQFGARQGLYVAAAVVQLLGLLYVFALDRAFGARRPRARIVVLIGGSMVTIVWGSLTEFRHLDDSLTLVCLGFAALAITRSRPLSAGLLLGLAAASKPWGIPLLALALAPAARQDRAKSAVVAVSSAALWWLPFALADRGTLLVGKLELHLSQESALWALGVHEVAEGQTLRLLQFGTGAAVALLLVLRGRWTLAPLAVFACRLLLEPSAYSYYAAGVTAAALLADLGGLRQRLPFLTIVATGGWVASESLAGASAGVVRLLLYGGLVLVSLGLGLRPSASRPAVA